MEGEYNVDYGQRRLILFAHRAKIVKQRRLTRKDAPHPLSTLVLTVDVHPSGGRLVFVDTARARKKAGIVSGPFSHANADVEALLHLLKPRREWERPGEEGVGSKLLKLVGGVGMACRGELAVVVCE